MPSILACQAIIPLTIAFATVAGTVALGNFNPEQCQARGIGVVRCWQPPSNPWIVASSFGILGSYFIAAAAQARRYQREEMDWMNGANHRDISAITLLILALICLQAEPSQSPSQSTSLNGTQPVFLEDDSQPAGAQLRHVFPLIPI